MDANPGPIDGSILYDQDKHVSAAVWDGQVTQNHTIRPMYIFTRIHTHMHTFKM